MFSFNNHMASFTFPFLRRFPNRLATGSTFGFGPFAEYLLCSASASSLSCLISPFSQSSSLLFRLSRFGLLAGLH